MGKVNIIVNGRRYAMGCDDGEEARLAGLGEKLDSRISELANQFGQIGDLRLLVMAGITMLDELQEGDNRIETRAEQLAADVRKASEDAMKAASRDKSRAANGLAEAAKRIEKITAKINRI